MKRLLSSNIISVELRAGCRCYHSVLRGIGIRVHDAAILLHYDGGLRESDNQHDAKRQSHYQVST
jgi:hypothetical protein